MPTPPPRLAPASQGRSVAYDVHGDPTGPAVLYLHGVPSSRLEVHLFGLPAAAETVGVRLVALDRAGIGQSSPRRQGSLSSAATDVAAVADHLELDSFGLLGYSAGAPSALATATMLCERARALTIVSGIGPGDRPDLADEQSPDVARMFTLARKAPALLSAGLRFMRYGTRNPARLVTAVAKSAPAPDARVLARPGADAEFAAFLAEAFAQGVAGVRDDFRLAAGPWPFDLADLAMPVRLWHGEVDRNAPVAGARWLAGQLADAQLRTSDDGHASLIATHGQAILADLVAASAGNVPAQP
ncbi:alpha/beta fold hydrolase [Georgenia yuyongxinii]|uniref:alpha/beta fold hydrolase n=1 Tax=Georgenia yuyongxinii TaxID=2589797 RepID=UPI00143CC4A6|nr:alpha/beta hydrolase [Georgenia yuyongxinii]